MVHPMMMSADMWDVTRDDGAVGILHKAGIDPWVIDFGSPDKVEGGMQRNLADHVVALSEAIDTVKEVTGRDVHLAGYSQGGMFAYQTAAYRRSKDLASIVAFGAPVDTLAALPMNLPARLAAAAADFMADHVVSAASTSRVGWRAPGSRCSTRSRPRSRGWTSCASCTTARRCCPANSSAGSWHSEGWIAWSGPAIAELLKQFIAHNRMMSGGFSIHGDLVTLSDIDCPVLAVVGEVDDIGQPASVRGIKRAAPQADVYEFLIRAGHFGLVVGSKAANQTWPTVAQWVKWIDGGGDMPDDVAPMALQPAEHSESGVSISSRVAHGTAAATEMVFSVARSAADAFVAANKSARTLAVETARTLPRLARLGQINDHTRISLGRIMSEQARDLPSGECAAVRRPCAHLRGGGPPHQQRRARPHRGRRAPGRARRRADGDQAERTRRDRRAVAAGRGRGPDAARRRPGRRGPARGGVGRSSPTRATWRRRASSIAGAGARRRRIARPDLARTKPTSSTWRRSTPTSSTCPAGTGRTRAWPATSRSSAFSSIGGELVARQITNYRWALSAFGTASAANLGRGDTVYCLTPLHHQSGLLVSLGGAVVGGPASRCRGGCGRTGSSRRSASTASRWCPTPGRCCARSSTTRRSR